MVRDAIHSSDTGRQIGYIENKQAFNLKGKRLYNVDGLNLIDPRTKKVVGDLSRPGGPNTRAADHLFTTENN
jgi:hypothetical protein